MASTDRSVSVSQMVHIDARTQSPRLGIRTSRLPLCAGPEPGASSAGSRLALHYDDLRTRRYQSQRSRTCFGV